MASQPTLAGVPLKYVSLLTLTVQNSALTILLHYSRTSPTAKPYSAPAAVLLNELLKGSISFAIALRNSFSSPAPPASSHYVPLRSSALSGNGHSPSHSPSISKGVGTVELRKASADVTALGLGAPAEIEVVGQGEVEEKKRWGAAGYAHHHVDRDWYLSADGWRTEFVPRAYGVVRGILSRDCWKLSIPAILYVIQNNLQFVAASNLDVASFQVTYQLKILTTALCSVVMLKRRVTMSKWWCLLFLAIGVALVQLENVASSSPSSHPTGDPFTGFVAVLAACFTSGLAGVYFELVLKGSNVDLWIRNVQLSLFSLLPALAAAFVPDISLTGAPSSQTQLDVRPSLFANFGVWAWATVLCQVVGGLVTALVIKFADNILKGFATSLSIVISFAAGIILFDFQLSLGFAVGCLTVLGATYMYNRPETPGSPTEGIATGTSNGVGFGDRRKRGGGGGDSPLPISHKVPMPSPTPSFDLARAPLGSPPGHRRPHDSATPDGSDYESKSPFGPGASFVPPAGSGVGFRAPSPLHQHAPGGDASASAAMQRNSSVGGLAAPNASGLGIRRPSTGEQGRPDAVSIQL